ncbi:MAG: UDP-3-O-(3-hydroxymyristoyl)glucosamine N-acyltransferase [Planctomycetes bacterium]|nr:UDP-3-O-(3-hydroxymyristoyl)glucosamine N-acyltransferase [Planctomycetota bacterium]
MAFTLRELAEHIGGNVVGDPETKILRPNTIHGAGEGDITFLSNKKYEKALDDTKASAVVISPEHEDHVKTAAIISDNPYLAFAKIVDYMIPGRPRPAAGVHPTAVVSQSAQVGDEAAIGPYCVIGDDVSIGDRVAIYSNVYVGKGTTIGEDTVIYPNTVLYDQTVIGRRVILHANVTIGSDGFGFAPDGAEYYKIPQIGNAIIEDDVSIGANTVINRGALQYTIIRKGCKIDSNCVISHNVDVGENTLMISQVGISGTVKIGKHCLFTGQVGVVGHLEIGDNVTVAAQSGVTHDLPDGSTYFGTPAVPIKEAREQFAALHKLPTLRKQIRKLEMRVEELENAKGE